jgi:hypothetical protein
VTLRRARINDLPFKTEVGQIPEKCHKRIKWSAANNAASASGASFRKMQQCRRSRFQFWDYLQVVGGRAFDGGAVMSRNQPVLVAPILGLSIPVPTYLGLSFTQPEAIAGSTGTAAQRASFVGTADQSPAGATACQSDPHQQTPLPRRPLPRAASDCHRSLW